MGVFNYDRFHKLEVIRETDGVGETFYFAILQPLPSRQSIIVIF